MDFANLRAGAWQCQCPMKAHTLPSWDQGEQSLKKDKTVAEIRISRRVDWKSSGETSRGTV